ncbi:transposase family protein [Sphingobium sp.]|uniref:transposase family protein n=1 Tax=Sphingobium sp. TaxID=1912891 RepID=UPI00391D0B33
MPKRLLPLVSHEFVVEQVATCRDRVVVVCRARRRAARCPTCRKASTRTHSHYRRCYADLPWQGRPVTICLLVRRMRCANATAARTASMSRATPLANDEIKVERAFSRAHTKVSRMEEDGASDQAGSVWVPAIGSPFSRGRARAITAPMAVPTAAITRTRA